jgi:hypothetical protein
MPQSHVSNERFSDIRSTKRAPHRFTSNLEASRTWYSFKVLDPAAGAALVIVKQYSLDEREPMKGRRYNKGYLSGGRNT